MPVFPTGLNVVAVRLAQSDDVAIGHENAAENVASVHVEELVFAMTDAIRPMFLSG